MSNKVIFFLCDTCVLFVCDIGGTHNDVALILTVWRDRTDMGIK